MVAVLLSLSDFIDRVNEVIGKTISWLTSLLVLLIVYDVLMRYGLNQSSVWIAELEWHMFALVFLLGAAYTLKEDQHVRVDVWYARKDKRTQAWMNLLGSLIFLIPMCLIIIKTGFSYTLTSFSIHESSPDPGGLPARYLIKSTMVVAGGLLLFQGISTALRSGIAIFSPSAPK
jgi:TRAP-type mannitol/chloroaromatic compound transport system permease small subunit